MPKPHERTKSSSSTGVVAPAVGNRRALSKPRRLLSAANTLFSYFWYFSSMFSGILFLSPPYTTLRSCPVRNASSKCGTTHIAVGLILYIERPTLWGWMFKAIIAPFANEKNDHARSNMWLKGRKSSTMSFSSKGMNRLFALRASRYMS